MAREYKIVRPTVQQLIRPRPVDATIVAFRVSGISQAARSGTQDLDLAWGQALAHWYDRVPNLAKVARAPGSCSALPESNDSLLR